MLQQLTQPLQGLGQGSGGQKPVAHLLEGLLTEGREKVLPAAGGFLGSRQSPGAGYRLVQGQLFPLQGQCVEIVGALALFTSSREMLYRGTSGWKSLGGSRYMPRVRSAGRSVLV